MQRAGKSQLFSSVTSMVTAVPPSRRKTASRLACAALLCVAFQNLLFDAFDFDHGRHRSLSIFSSRGSRKLSAQQASLLAEVIDKTPLGSGLAKKSTSSHFKLVPMFKKQLRHLVESNEDGRGLAIYNGPGDCQLSAPVPPPDESVYSTFLVGFPGVGKKLAWSLMEQLTGSAIGDDWDHSRNGYNVVFMKGTFPQHESPVWQWGANMDQTILMVRNPRWALPSYRDTRYELDYSTTWAESHSRIDFVYTEQGPTMHFDAWKDPGVQGSNSKLEIKLWSWYIDWWMEEGLKRDEDHEQKQVVVGQEIVGYTDNIIGYSDVIIGFDTVFNVTYYDNGTVATNETINTPILEEQPDYEPIMGDVYGPEMEYFEKCTDGSLSCKPVDVVSYEALNDPITGPTELGIIAGHMMGKPGNDIITPDAWACLYNKTVAASATYWHRGMAYREMFGDAIETKVFNATEIQWMRDEITYVRDKYSSPPWDVDGVAAKLVGYMNQYLAELL